MRCNMRKLKIGIMMGLTSLMLIGCSTFSNIQLTESQQALIAGIAEQAFELGKIQGIAYINQQVKEGKISQEQADLLIQAINALTQAKAIKE